MADRETETAQLLEKTYACFVKQVVVAKEVSLAHVAFAKTVKDRRSDAVRSIRNRVDN